jgi:hypothetical protein
LLYLKTHLTHLHEKKIIFFLEKKIIFFSKKKFFRENQEKTFFVVKNVLNTKKLPFYRKIFELLKKIIFFSRKKIIFFSKKSRKTFFVTVNPL